MKMIMVKKPIERVKCRLNYILTVLPCASCKSGSLYTQWISLFRQYASRSEVWLQNTRISRTYSESDNTQDSTMSYLVNIFQYEPTKVAIEYAYDKKPQNFLVFIGGLSDGFLCAKYVPKIAELFNKDLEGNWGVVEALITSSYVGFGTGSLKRDVRELGQLVKHLRTERGTKDSKVVLIGHSTGCQDTMEYLTKFTYEEDFEDVMRLDGGILQAPVSDTECAEDYHNAEDLKEALQETKQLIDEGKGHYVINDGKAKKLSFDSPTTAYRFYSLNARRTDDDYFSTYLTDEDYKTTFGKLQLPLLVLVGEKDEYVPKSIDRQALLEHWEKVSPKEFWSPLSKVVKGADHKGGGPYADEGAADDIARTVVKFIKATI